MNDIINIDKKYVASTYNRFPIEIISGKGSIARDSDGKEYIDMGCGIGVTSFGISDEIWKDAVISQLNKVQHMSNLYYTEPCAKLAEELCIRSGMKKIFFSNSGAEANECAIKAARKYSSDKYDNTRNIIVTLKNSFHGRTLTTLAATGQDCFHKLYTPLTPGFISIDAENTDEIDTLKKRNDIAAIMIECIQGEGGVNTLSHEYIKKIEQYAYDYDVILIVDEVQTGNGRCGALYSYMNYGITPDIVSTAKGLGGGLPLGATLLGDKVKNIFSYGDNGSTFGGNPVSCAGALSIIKRIDEKLLKDVNKKGKYIKDEFSKSKCVESVSGMGLMIGIKPKGDAKKIVGKCLGNGILCLTAKDKIRLLPALNIDFDILKKAVNIIIKCIEEE